MAAKYGHENVVKTLLENPETDIYAKDNLERTALNMALIEGHDKVFNVILENSDFDINTKDIGGRSALILAAKDGKMRL